MTDDVSQLDGLVDGLDVHDSDEGELIFAADNGTAQHQGRDSRLRGLAGLVLDPSMALARDSFCEQHCTTIQDLNSDTEQQLFEQYKSLMEAAFCRVQQQSGSDGPLITLQELSKDLEDEQADASTEEVLELLQSVSNLDAFSALLHEYKEAAHELGQGPLELQGSKASLHAEEQEEGEERPDLDSLLSVAAVNPQKS